MPQETAAPLSLSAVYELPDYQAIQDYYRCPYDGFRYGRDASPSVLHCEREIEKLYPGYRALLFGSGMTATTAMLDVFMTEQSTLFIPNEHYRKLRVLTGARWRAVHYQDVKDIKPNGNAVIWVESPSNPHLKLADYGHLVTIKRNHGAQIIGDLTLAGLDNFKGTLSIFDAIMHSCAKYAGGHNDIMAGLALVKPEAYSLLWDRRSFAGGILDPFSGWLLARSLKTYSVRIERQLINTRRLLVWLRNEIGDERIFYPELQVGDAKKFHDHHGSVVSFLAREKDSAKLTEKIGQMKTFRMVPNFGSVDSLAEVPATMSHYGKSAEELNQAGIEPNLVRLSIGLEPVADLIADLETVV